MANLSELRSEWEQRSGREREEWFDSQMIKALSRVSTRLNNANVVLYFSACLHKHEYVNTGMRMEDIDGWMNVFYKMDFEKELVVIMHTLGGNSAAVELISEYIHSKFKKVTVVVPVACMSMGAMFCLSCDEIIISRAGQLGPIDLQIPTGQRQVSVKDIIAEFNRARSDILKNERAEHVWTPILQTYGPGLYELAVNLERHTKEKVKEWLQRKEKKSEEADEIVKFFHDLPDFHAQRIGYESIRNLGLNVRLLEDKQELQDATMEAYHLATIGVENSGIVKFITSNTGQSWAKNTALPSS